MTWLDIFRETLDGGLRELVTSPAMFDDDDHDVSQTLQSGFVRKPIQSKMTVLWRERNTLNLSNIKKRIRGLAFTLASHVAFRSDTN